jgi:hypothetical protein
VAVKVDQLGRGLHTARPSRQRAGSGPVQAGASREISILLATDESSHRSNRGSGAASSSKRLRVVQRTM